MYWWDHLQSDRAKTCVAQDDIPRKTREAGQAEAVDAEDEGQDVQDEAQGGIYIYV